MTASRLANQRDSLLLVRQGERLFLKRGRQSLLLQGPPQEALLRDTQRVWTLLKEPDPQDPERNVVIGHRGKTVTRISLERLRDQWLKIDALWGQGKAGNEMRYMHQSAGGVQGFLDEVYPTKAGWLGVLSWRLMGPSLHPIGARHLVRIAATAQATIEPLRLLDSRGPESPFAPSPRLFPQGDKLLVWEPDALAQVGPRGERMRTFLRLTEATLPHSLLGKRWLVCLSQNAGTRITVVDLEKKQIYPLLNDPGPRFTRILAGDETTGNLLLAREEGEGKESLWLLSCPQGKQVQLPVSWQAPSVRLGLGYLILPAPGGYDVYAPTPLKLRQRLGIPAVVNGRRF